MPSRAELEVRARNLGIDPATYANDSVLEQRVIYVSKRTGAATGTLATGTLTSDATAPNDGDTVTIGDIVYRFKTTPAQAYDVAIGASAAIALDNLKAAINASGTPGTEYFAGTAAHPQVTATTNTNTTQVVQSRFTDLGNTIPTTETSTHLSWGGATLAGGVPGVIVATGNEYQLSGGSPV